MPQDTYAQASCGAKAVRQADATSVTRGAEQTCGTAASQGDAEFAQHQVMLVRKRRRALQTGVHPSQRDPHCKTVVAKPTVMVIAWQWSGEVCTWMR